MHGIITKTAFNKAAIMRDAWSMLREAREFNARPLVTKGRFIFDLMQAGVTEREALGRYGEHEAKRQRLARIKTFSDALRFQWFRARNIAETARREAAQARQTFRPLSGFDALRLMAECSESDAIRQRELAEIDALEAAAKA